MTNAGRDEADPAIDYGLIGPQLDAYVKLTGRPLVLFGELLVRRILLNADEVDFEVARLGSAIACVGGDCRLPSPRSRHGRGADFANILDREQRLAGERGERGRSRYYNGRAGQQREDAAAEI